MAAVDHMVRHSFHEYSKRIGSGAVSQNTNAGNSLKPTLTVVHNE